MEGVPDDVDVAADVHENPLVSSLEREVRAQKLAAEKLTSDGRYKLALHAWQQALSLVQDPTAKAHLLTLRSQCYLDYSRQLRAIPAAESESSAQFGLDPSQLASLAAKDAERALALVPGLVDAHLCQGDARALMEEYSAAEAAYLEALALDAGNSAALEGLEAVNRVTRDSGGRKRGLQRDLDDLDCTICCKLLYKPVTTPCGHTFCQSCFARSMDHNTRCPMCRRVLHSGLELPVSIVLQNVLERSFPDETSARRRESCSEGVRPGLVRGASGAAVPATRDHPIFVMACIIPGEKMELNIFEPRYRLMVRRCMEGDRRLVMSVALQGNDQEHFLPPVACECEITECQLQPDGRYHLELTGRRAVKMVRDWEVDGYRMCEVAAPETSAASEELATLSQAVEARAEELLQRADTEAQRSQGRLRLMLLARLQEVGTKPASTDPDAISWWVARTLQLSNHQKLQMLLETDLAERFRKLQEFLDDPRQANSLGRAQCTIM